jgi:hypothetical protein
MGKSLRPETIMQGNPEFHLIALPVRFNGIWHHTPAEPEPTDLHGPSVALNISDSEIQPGRD